MANRSYLYSIDFDRTLEERSEDKKVRGLSEWPYEIPLAYKILVSRDAKLSPSIIFDYEKPIAIIGDFYKGREKLFHFLEELSKTNLIEKDELGALIRDAKKYLYDAKNEAEYTILECGEIYEMGHEDIEVANTNLYENEILRIDETIRDYMVKIQNTQNIAEAEKHEIDSLVNRFEMTAEQAINQIKLNLLGISYWSDVLYYQ